MTDRRMGAYSAWLSGVTPFTIERLASFYALQPELLPDLVYVDSEYGDCAARFCEILDYTVQPFAHGLLLVQK